MSIMSASLTLDFVNDIKFKYDNPLVIFKKEDVYEIIGEDADWCINNVGLHNIFTKEGFSFVAYVSANHHITSKIIQLAKKRIVFIDEIPAGSCVQMSLF